METNVYNFMQGRDIMGNRDLMEKVVFAEKIVQQTMAFHEIPLRSFPAVLHHLSQLHYTEIIRCAITCLIDELDDVAEADYVELCESNSLTSEGFLSHIRKSQWTLFSDTHMEHDIHDFLNFFVFVSCLAARFYHAGVLDAPDCALAIIFECFKDNFTADLSDLENCARDVLMEK